MTQSISSMNTNSSRFILLANHLNGSKKLETIVVKDGAPPIGPYVAARKVKADANLIYASGQIGADAKTNIIPDCVVEQTKNVMQNLEKILKASNSSFSNAVKATVFLADMNDFNKVNQEYAKWFKDEAYPARVCFSVKGLPRGAKVEIDIIAVEES